MSTTAIVKKLGEIFRSNAFVIPDYQRTYAWELRQKPESLNHQIEDFWEDIQEAFDYSSTLMDEGRDPQQYYWGTLTLNRNKLDRKDGIINSYPEYSIVDGQQRIITAMLLLIAFKRVTECVSITSMLKIGPEPRLRVGLLNINAFSDLIDNAAIIRDTHLRTNKRLVDAVEFFKDKIKGLEPSYVLGLLDYFLNATISLEFDSGDDYLATQAFLSLNDRGKPLTVLEKMKGILSSIDTRYFGSSLSGLVNGAFSEVYMALDTLNAIGDKNGLSYFKVLNDESFLRLVYHYSAQVFINQYVLGSGLLHDCRATSGEALEFIKAAARHLFQRRNDLEQMIRDLLCNMKLVADALVEIANQADVSSSRPDIFNLFKLLEIDPNLVICLVGAQIKGFLSEDLVRELENVDIRVFKVSRLDRIKPLHDKVIPRLRDKSDTGMINNLKEYRNWFAPDHFFKARIAPLYGLKNDKYILWKYQTTIDSEFEKSNISLFEGVTVEHIFAQTPRIILPGGGFVDAADYALSINLAGNLSLLEHLNPNLQKQANNRPPRDKATFVYPRSSIPDIKKLSTSIGASGFTKSDVLTRTTDLQDFAVERWS